MLRVLEKFLSGWAETARRGGLLLVIAILLATGAAGYFAATTLKVNTDTSEMLDPDLPFQKNAAALRAAFPQIKSDVIVLIKGPTLDETDAFAAALRERLAARADVVSDVYTPAADPFFLQNGLLYLDETELESRLAQMTRASGLIETLVASPTSDTLFATLAENDALAERSELGADTLAKIYAELGDVVAASLEGETRPFAWMGAISGEATEAHTRLLYATPTLDFGRLQPARPAIAAMRAEIETLDAEFGGRVETWITGDPALRGEELESVTTGIGLSFGLSFILVAGLLLICFRSLALAVMTLATLIVTLIFTSAFAAFAIGELNLVSVAFTVLLVGLGLDFAIHLLLHYQERRAKDQAPGAALFGSMHEVGPALALAAVTTSLAFFSFVPTAFDGIAQLGLIAGAGVIIALLVTLTFIPAALSFAPGGETHWKQKGRRDGPSLGERLAGPIAVATIALGLGALFFLPQARFDADPMALRDASSQSVRGFNLLFDDPETVPYRLTTLAANAEEAEAAATTAKALPTVAGARSLPDFVPDDQDAKLELIDFAAGTLVFALEAEPQAGAEDSGGAAALRARLLEAYPDGPGARLAGLLGEAEAAGPDAAARLEENLFRFWPALVERLGAQLGADYVGIDDLPAPLAQRYRSEDGQWRVDILPKEDVRDRTALARFVDEVDDAFPDVSGGALQTKKAGDVISASMLEATAIALIIIALFLFVLVRNASLVFLMILPLLLAAALTTAAGVLLDIPFNYANVIVLPLLLGIGVDSGIHLVLRQQQVDAGEDVYGTSTPRAILFSSLTTVASFASLMLSPHRGTASMGELLSIAIAFTLICTLFVLPAAFRYGLAHSGRRAPKG